ncbi:coiled-coil domain-containing protein 77 isoform X1 [Oenanthe melanoleuca]|uniref:coiled-coil domain-containing protein 77 isoform X1 n=1 Tax=Oenanthe melanoleuca TaxID=2939378 RepID=UPI0024C19E9C|nr:coiled-coil domain-containing protein 77 isoform X1 [Oenanthe melanoleuca]
MGSEGRVAGIPRSTRLSTPHASSRSESRFPSREDFTPLPSVSERLTHLNPSHELLDYYRKRVAAFDEEHEELVKTLEKYKQAYDEQHQLQWEVHHLEEEIAELQKALSDMQMYLFQEREQVLCLYAENDRLKLREMEDKKKIQQLLAALGRDEGEVTYFHKEPPHKVTVLPRPAETHQPDDVSSTVGTEQSTLKPTPKGEKPASSERYQKDDETLLLQVKALQAQMEEQTRLAKEQVEALLEDRRIQMEEAEFRHRRDQDRIKSMSEKLHKTQSLLYESTRDFLHLKLSARANEKAWMAEKDSLLRKLGKDLDHLAFSTESGKKKQRELKKTLQENDGASKLHNKEIKVLQDKLMQEKHLSHMYREQCVSLEGEVARIREERDVGKELFKERSEKMEKRLKMMTRRCEALEKRRNMEVEGFKNDIKQLQQKLKGVEKHIYKVALNLGPDQDLAILREVRQGNKLTRKIQGELKDLKAKIFTLEDELRHC